MGSSRDSAARPVSRPRSRSLPWVGGARIAGDQGGSICCLVDRIFSAKRESLVDSSREDWRVCQNFRDVLVSANCNASDGNCRLIRGPSVRFYPTSPQHSAFQGATNGKYVQAKCRKIPESPPVSTSDNPTSGPLTLHRTSRFPRRWTSHSATVGAASPGPETIDVHRAGPAIPVADRPEVPRPVSAAPMARQVGPTPHRSGPAAPPARAVLHRAPPYTARVSSHCPTSVGRVQSRGRDRESAGDSGGRSCRADGQTDPSGPPGRTIIGRPRLRTSRPAGTRSR